MIIPVNKEKIMDEFKTKYVEGRFYEESPKIYEMFEDNKKSIIEELILKFKEVCKKAINMQEQGLKGEIKYIYISYLRTSLMQNLGVYRIDFYDDKWLLDKEECFINIDLSFIYEPLFNHMEELQIKRKEYGRTITEMDIEKIKIKEGNKYHRLGIKILESIVNDFVECDEYKEMKKNYEISILAGEYCDEAVLIYETSKEK
ncbi:hypothetical protein psyc5s11_35270 [Clostridium gelidum]|uniref:Uncharacterized protein n=1 Tax=Clostridium gelidum TaxID=704125 RepID=A0ABM7T611_9CLOT|nr:hypothetical protein [Clostridium gelidum]BCZ47460.1 hypothetical protein psyc5s11_35270 [Clostridium gelidum]